MVRQALQCPHPSLGLGGPHPTPDSFIGESTQHRFRNETKGGTSSLCQGQGAGQRVSALHAPLQELSLSPSSTKRQGASVFQPQHPPRPFSLTTEVPATAQLPSQPSHPSPGHSCTHKSRAECDAQGQERGCWLRARAESGEHRHGGKVASGCQWVVHSWRSC